MICERQRCIICDTENSKNTKANFQRFLLFSLLLLFFKEDLNGIAQRNLYD